MCAVILKIDQKMIDLFISYAKRDLGGQQLILIIYFFVVHLIQKAFGTALVSVAY